MRLLAIRTFIVDADVVTIYLTLGPNLSRKIYILNHLGLDVTPPNGTLQLLRRIVADEGLNIPDYDSPNMTTVALGVKILEYGFQ